MGTTPDCVGDLPNRPVATLEPTRTLREMIGALVRHDVGLLVVMDGNLIRGVVSERDVIDAIYEGADIDHKTVGQIAHRDVIEVPATTSIVDAARTMIDRRVRHLLIQGGDEDVPASVISMRDVLEPLVSG